MDGASLYVAQVLYANINMHGYVYVYRHRERERGTANPQITWYL